MWMMKQKRIWLVISLFLILVLSGCKNKFYIISDKEENRYTEENMKYFGTVKEPVDDIKEIQVNTQYADFEIIASDAFYMEYSYYYIDEEPVLTIVDGVLTFDDSNMNQSGYSISLKKSNYFKLYVPTTAEFGKVRISVSSGNVSIGSFAAEDVKVTNSYGDTIIASTSIDKLTSITSSGRLTLERCGIGEAKIENRYGDVILKNINEQSDTITKEYPEAFFDIELSSGNLDIDKLYAKNLQFNNSYGDVELEESTITSFKGKLSSGDATAQDCIMDQVDLNNSYGNISMLLIGKQEDYCFDITSKYGDVRVGKKLYNGSVLIDRGGTKKIEIYLSSGDAKVTFR